jgi:hypothetical protein
MINELIELKKKIESKDYFYGSSFRLIDTTTLFKKIYQTIEKVIEYVRSSDQTIQQLKQSNDQLQKKIDFFYTIYEHNTSMVYQMNIKTKNGNPVWVDSLRTGVEFLETLDKDEEVDQWIHERKYTRYSDKNY